MTPSSKPLSDTNEQVEKEILIKEMMHQVANLQQRFQSEGADDERRWMIDNTNDAQIIKFLKESSVMMLHVIDAVGELQPVNGITISKQFGIPRGSVSKITRKLVEQKMLQSEYLPDNKKEVLFHLTPLGQHMFKLHKSLHAHINHNVRNFLNKYDNDQMRFLVACMKDTLQASLVDSEANNPEDTAAANVDNQSNRAITERENVSQEAMEISEIHDMLQQLDARKLKKAKDLLQIALFD